MPHRQRAARSVGLMEAFWGLSARRYGGKMRCELNHQDKKALRRCHFQLTAPCFRRSASRTHGGTRDEISRPSLSKERVLFGAYTSGSSLTVRKATPQAITSSAIKCTDLACFSWGLKVV